MELRVLNYFLMVAREENITQAAQLLHVTQPTLSRQLMQLEQELGVKLFHRSSHSILLTDEGRLLKRRAQEILDLTERTKREFVRTESLSGEIAIGSGEYKSTGFFADLLVSFHREHPLVRYALYSGNSDNIKERIESGALDLGLLFEPVDKRRYQFVRFPIRERWGVLADGLASGGPGGGRAPGPRGRPADLLPARAGPKRAQPLAGRLRRKDRDRRQRQPVPTTWRPWPRAAWGR